MTIDSQLPTFDFQKEFVQNTTSTNLTIKERKVMKERMSKAFNDALEKQYNFFRKLENKEAAAITDTELLQYIQD